MLAGRRVLRQYLSTSRFGRRWVALRPGQSATPARIPTAERHESKPFAALVDTRSSGSSTTAKTKDSFTEARRSLHRLDNPQAFSSWLCSIVIRTAHKLLRRRKLMTVLGLRQREAIDLDALIARLVPQNVLVELRAVYGLVETLSSTTRIAFILCRVEGVRLEEISGMLGISLATVKRRIADAERQLEKWTALGPAHRRPATLGGAQRRRNGKHNVS